jgi:chromosome segregation ATPase
VLCCCAVQLDVSTKVLTKLKGEKNALEKAKDELEKKIAAADKLMGDTATRLKAAEDRGKELEAENKKSAGRVDELEKKMSKMVEEKKKQDVANAKLAADAERANEFKKNVRHARCSRRAGGRAAPVAHFPVSLFIPRCVCSLRRRALSWPPV